VIYAAEKEVTAMAATLRDAGTEAYAVVVPDSSPNGQEYFIARVVAAAGNGSLGAAMTATGGTPERAWGNLLYCWERGWMDAAYVPLIPAASSAEELRLKLAVTKA
jgi:hypothetical protein